VRRIGKELMEKGTFELLFNGAIPFDDVNRMMGRQLS
jgi:hypothetical protein